MKKSIEGFVKELADKTKDLLSHEISIIDYHSYVTGLETDVRELAFNDKKFNNQKTYDLFNLCHELADASSFDNREETIFVIALEILDNKLGNMYLSDQWKRVVKLRGPIEEISQYSCKGCDNRFPVITFSGFSDDMFAYCEICGDILLMHKYWVNSKLEKDNLTLEDYEKELPKCKNDGGDYRFSFAYHGRFSSADLKCYKCGSEELQLKKISRYQYFQEHNYSYFQEV